MWGKRPPPITVNVGSESSTRAASETAEQLDAKLKALHKLVVDLAGDVGRQHLELTSLQSGQFHILRAVEKVEKRVAVPQPGRGPRRHGLDVEPVLVPFPEHLRRDVG